MVRLTTAEEMQKAIDKARAVKPRVRVVAFGSYIVTNKQTGAAYTVTCEKRNGERFADCNWVFPNKRRKCFIAFGVNSSLSITCHVFSPPAK